MTWFNSKPISAVFPDTGQSEGIVQRLVDSSSPMSKECSAERKPDLAPVRPPVSPTIGPSGSRGDMHTSAVGQRFSVAMWKMRIEDYGLIGDTQTAALVGIDGSIDWLCLPRFDSGACFAALLGDRSHGRWRLGPAAHDVRVERRYVPGTLVLETTFHTADGTARVVDCMPIRGSAPDVVRIVEGVAGHTVMEMDLVVRFDYGSTVPWVRRLDGTWSLVAGPDALELFAGVPVHGEDLSTVTTFTVGAGDRVAFVLTWHSSSAPAPRRADPDRVVPDTVAWWEAWSDRCVGGGRWETELRDSLVTLKALTYAPTGGIVAAPTTSLPEVIGGVRNWDYRYCWLRDATFTLQALLAAGFDDEAVAWRDWLLRALAGDPSQLQIMYGVAGERRLPELELGWLPGYEGSGPVRIGNGAATQRQLDVPGEVMDALHQARLAGIPPSTDAWEMQRTLLDWLESAWRETDSGLWEVRGEPRHFVHSKMMCWVAFDRGVQAVERFGVDGPAVRWAGLRDAVHAEVCQRGWDAQRGGARCQPAHDADGRFPASERPSSGRHDRGRPA